MRVRGTCPKCGTKLETEIDGRRFAWMFDRMDALFDRMDRIFRKAFR